MRLTVSTTTASFCFRFFHHTCCGPRLPGCEPPEWGLPVTGDHLPVSRGTPIQTGNGSPLISPSQCDPSHIFEQENQPNGAPNERHRTTRNRLIRRAQSGSADCRGPRGAYMQKPRHRIRSHRRPIALASATALVIAAMATASSTLPIASRASAGPVATARSAGIAPCRIPATMGVQMSEGMPTPEGYARSTGRVRALNLMIDFPDAPGRRQGDGPVRRILPADHRLVPDRIVRPPHLRPRRPAEVLAADATAVLGVRDRARLTVRTGLPPPRPGHRHHRRYEGGFRRVRPGQHPGHPEQQAPPPWTPSCP